jgi:hypothetical protein
MNWKRLGHQASRLGEFAGASLGRKRHSGNRAAATGPKDVNRAGLLPTKAESGLVVEIVEEDIQSRLEKGEILPEPKNDILVC